MEFRPGHQRITGRIHIFGVLAGVLAVSCIHFFLMALVAAMGLWTFRVSDIPYLDSRFWLAATTTWIIASGVGGYITTFAAEIVDPKEASLNAFLTWAGAYLLFGGMTSALSESQNQLIDVNLPLHLIRMAFIGDFLAFCACQIAASLVVRRTELSIAGIELKRKLENKKINLISRLRGLNGRAYLTPLAVIIIATGLYLDQWWWQVGAFILGFIVIDAFLRYRRPL